MGFLFWEDLMKGWMAPDGIDGQKIEMTAQKFGQKLPPISPARVVEAPASRPGRSRSTVVGSPCDEQCPNQNDRRDQPDQPRPGRAS
jgi:hypothetical protein